MDEREMDVFLSFSCETSQAGFLDHLLQNGMKTFLSYKCLETSLIPIDQQTLEALQESKLAVVMTSKAKACTVGFLEELRVILEFQAKGSLAVIPISLTDLRFTNVNEEIWKHHQAGSWMDALGDLARIANEYPFSKRPIGMDQTVWLKQIAHEIYRLLLYSTSNDLKVLVAMDRHMKVVYPLLASETSKEVRTIGIWGTTGVGKTTLARYINEEISADFQTHVFLENVENMKDKILEFEGEEDPSVVRSLDGDWHEITEARRKHREVLLIADDVNTIEQMKWIIGYYANRFAPGSRVILISQNENLLVDAGVKHLYEVRSLRYDEALQLFSHFAFKQPYPPSDFEQLAVRAVHLAGFLPLSLRLLGSFLNGRAREEWEAALLKLMKNEGQSIKEVWKLMERHSASDATEVKGIMEGKESSQDKQ